VRYGYLRIVGYSHLSTSACRVDTRFPAPGGFDDKNDEYAYHVILFI